MAELAKTYDPLPVEARWYAAWEEAGCFRSVPDDRPAYAIVIPPPNVTGVLHMGHMLNNTIQDVLVRRKRLEGFNAVWVPGTDHASIATEAKVVQKLRGEGITKQTLIDQHGYEGGRDKFLEQARAWKDQYGGIILQQLRKLGASCDWARTAYTMDGQDPQNAHHTGYYKDVVDTFVKLYNEGYIYRAERMVNWDPVAKTTLSDEEVIYKEVQGTLYYVRYQFVDPDLRLAVRDPEGNLLEERTYLTVATTRPETILGDTAIAVHPDDARYQALLGQRVRVPFLAREIPVVADSAIDPEFGTGCLKVTPAHAKADYEIYERLKAAGTHIEVVNTIAEDGTLQHVPEPWLGLDRFAMRKQFAQWLADNNCLEKAEAYTHNVGHSERTDAVVEERPSLQWWVRMKELCQPALEAVESGAVQLFPDRFLGTYRHWMTNVKDWCISRQLWWGHRIPAWYDTSGGLVQVSVTGGEGLAQDPDVLDTWFSSWLWPLSVFNGLQAPDGPDIRYYYPTATLVTGPDILFFWVARMIVAGYYHRGEKPFDRVYLTGLVRDKQGRKMSKSLGNSPDPDALIERYSADGVRMGLLLSSAAGNDLLFDEALCEQGRNFANKLWNAFRLIHTLGESATPGPATPQQALATDWMAARTHEAAHEVARQFDDFRLSEALGTLYKLIWDDFCSWYLELIKPQGGSGFTEGAHALVVGRFEELLQLLSPFMPFITEEIWQLLAPRAKGEFLVQTRLPSTPAPDAATLAGMGTVREAVTALRALRTERNIPLKEALDVYLVTDQPARWQRFFPLVERFVGLGTLHLGVAGKPEQTVLVQVGTDELHVPVAVDVAAERTRLEAEIAYQEGFLKSVQAKLTNEKFVAGAKPEVVARERQKEADAEAKLSALRASLAALG
ncbi:MAG: valine--tRNA ligase [Bacteroidia bacterium]|nr:valine--tRNA ligase [Bacteroidia bacterium]